MASGVNGEPSILQNVLDEECVGPLEQRFFNELEADIAADGEPTTPQSLAITARGSLSGI
jgi:hypothetical protein